MQHRLTFRGLRAAATVSLAITVVAAVAGAPPVAAATVPASESFQAIQKQVTSLQGKMTAATVALRVGSASGSGVIISPDGYVLTAGHVSAKANQKCLVILASGKTYPGTTLGLDPETDYGLVKIEGGEGLPTAALGDSNTLRPGQWVVATGHPLGRRVGRPPVVRTGRVLGYPDRERNHTVTKVVTDAPLISGDSGGPLFDLNGRVVAINVMIGGGGRREGISMHTLVNIPKYAMDQLKKGETLTEPLGPPEEFTTALRDARAQLARGENAAALVSLGRCLAIDATDAVVRLMQAKVYARLRNPSAAISCAEQACSLGFNDVDALANDRDLAALATNPRYRPLVRRLELLAGLPGEKKNDRTLLDAAMRLAPLMERGTVRVLVDGREVALGVVMSASGDVLTKASELPEGEIRCILTDGRIVRAAARARDDKWDVVLLRLESGSVEPVDWSDGYAVGQWAFTPDGGSQLLGLGVVGVGEMPVKGRGIARRVPNSGFMGVRMEDLDPEALQKMGLAGGVRVEVDAETPASRAGIETGDVIFQADAEVIGEPDELVDYLADKKPGDRVSVRVWRNNERKQFDIVLGVRPAALAGGRPQRASLPEMLSGEISQMQGPFGTVLHHDTVLKPNAMGGPLVTNTGRCIGMNIARADRTSTYALPAKVVREIYQRLKR